MNILVVDNGSEHTDEIIDLFDGASVTKTTPFDPHLRETPEDTLVVLSGSRDTAVYGHEETYKNEIEFIRNFGGAIIGICLGFQLIAYAHGAELYKLGEKRKGIHTITATDAGGSLLPEKIRSVYEGHRWFVKEVSHPLVPLAVSQDGVEIFRHASRPIYATQFHPEVNKDNDGREIFGRIMDQIAAEINRKHDIIS